LNDSANVAFDENSMSKPVALYLRFERI